MTDDQFEDFWALLYSRGAPSRFAEPPLPKPASGSPKGGAVEPREEGGQRGRSSKPTPQRCGTCRGCVANDCGLCKNCRDKTKFGGPGIKKKACLRRVCYKLRDAEEDGEEDDDDDDGAISAHATGPPLPSSTASEPASEVTSPRARPCSPPDAPPPMESLETRRSPLEAIPTEPNTHLPEGAQEQLDVLSRMAARQMHA